MIYWTKQEKALDAYLKKWFELNRPMHFYTDCVVVIKYGHTVKDMREQNLIMEWQGDSSTKPEDDDWVFACNWDWAEGEQFIVVEKIFCIDEYPFEEYYICNDVIMEHGEALYG